MCWQLQYDDEELVVRGSRTRGEVGRLYRVLGCRGQGCCVRSTPRVRSFRCSTLLHRLRGLRTRFPRFGARSSPARVINNTTLGLFSRIQRAIGVRDLRSMFDVRRLRSFLGGLSLAGASFSIRPGVSNLSISLRCHSNLFFHNSAHNSNAINRSMATGLLRVGSVPGTVGFVNRLRIENRICVPHSDFVGLHRQRRLVRRSPTGGPQGTTTKALHRGGPGVMGRHRLSVFIFGIRHVASGRFASRVRALSFLGSLNFRALPACLEYFGIGRIITRIREVNSDHNTLPCSVSNTIVGTSGLTCHRAVNDASGFPG